MSELSACVRMGKSSQMVKTESTYRYIIIDILVLFSFHFSLFISSMLIFILPSDSLKLVERAGIIC